jgi:gliding motility-associated-like protein
LYPFLENIKKLANFKIYNKWGNLVFETTDRNEGWDGYFKGKIQPFETYTWYIEAYSETDELLHAKGKTILIP